MWGSNGKQVTAGRVLLVIQTGGETMYEVSYVWNANDLSVRHLHNERYYAEREVSSLEGRNVRNVQLQEVEQ